MLKGRMRPRLYENVRVFDVNGTAHHFGNAFAEAETKLHDDPEFLAILAEMDAAGQSFKSELLSIEITKE